MSEGKHTPLPKRLANAEVDGIIRLVNEDGNVVEENGEVTFEIILEEMLRRYNSHDQLVEALKLHCIICVKMSGYKKEWCDSCVTTKALKAAGEEV